MGAPARSRQEGQRVARATYADIEGLPEHVVGEILDGELFVSPRPAPTHARTGSTLGYALGPPFDRPPGSGGGQPGGWWLLDEPELHLGDDVLVPDMAGWRRERMPRFPREAFFRLPPDWACEVLSLRTARIDRIRKSRIYAREKVGHLWLLDPLAHTLEVCRLLPEGYALVALHEGDEVVRVEPFAEIELRLSDLWLPEEAAPE
ncbi:MAG: Uma2 family endonuclease [Deltaproteobacteria bacterium]|nr:Uma2 family endonuclease [Deltaproteobacteria bacterium]